MLYIALVVSSFYTDAKGQFLVRRVGDFWFYLGKSLENPEQSDHQSYSLGHGVEDVGEVPQLTIVTYLRMQMISRLSS